MFQTSISFLFFLGYSARVSRPTSAATSCPTATRTSCSKARGGASGRWSTWRQKRDWAPTGAVSRWTINSRRGIADYSRSWRKNPYSFLRCVCSWVVFLRGLLFAESFGGPRSFLGFLCAYIAVILVVFPSIAYDMFMFVHILTFLRTIRLLWGNSVGGMGHAYFRLPSNKRSRIGILRYKE